jgi:hypothetical protein
MRIPSEVKTTISQLWPIFVCMVLLLLIIGIGGCGQGYQTLQTSQETASAFIRSCDATTIQVTMSQQDAAKTMAVTCKASHD